MTGVCLLFGKERVLLLLGTLLWAETPTLLPFAAQRRFDRIGGWGE